METVFIYTIKLSVNIGGFREDYCLGQISTIIRWLIGVYKKLTPGTVDANHNLLGWGSLVKVIKLIRGGWHNHKENN